METQKLTFLPADIVVLVSDSVQEGYGFVRRLVDEYQSGENNFSAHGEALFAIRENGHLIGVGGVNIQPGSDPLVGRVRHVYIAKSARGLGVGKKLISEIEEHSRQYFNKLVLFTNFENAIGFYDKLGYKRVSLPKISHEKTIS